jgi:hypothetical protein
MALEVWFQRDVTRILAAAYETMRASSEHVAPDRSQVVDAYHRGFEDALRSVGIAFGVSVPGMWADGRIVPDRYAGRPRYLPTGTDLHESEDDGDVPY